MTLKPVIFLSKQTLQIPEKKSMISKVVIFLVKIFELLENKRCEFPKKINNFISCDFSRQNTWVTWSKQTLQIPVKN